MCVSVTALSVEAPRHSVQVGYRKLPLTGELNDADISPFEAS